MRCCPAQQRGQTGAGGGHDDIVVLGEEKAKCTPNGLPSVSPAGLELPRREFGQSPSPPARHDKAPVEARLAKKLPQRTPQRNPIRHSRDLARPSNAKSAGLCPRTVRRDYRTSCVVWPWKAMPSPSTAPAPRLPTLAPAFLQTLA
jgi:hypothetical protein